MTMLNRESEDLSPKLALSQIEMKILDHLKPNKKTTSKRGHKIRRLVTMFSSEECGD
jgi:hypothetical protein